MVLLSTSLLFRDISLILKPQDYVADEIRSNMLLTHTDVLVIGADPVGLFTAIRLGQVGLEIVVIEKDNAVLQFP